MWSNKIHLFQEDEKQSPAKEILQGFFIAEKTNIFAVSRTSWYEVQRSLSHLAIILFILERKTWNSW